MIMKTIKLFTVLIFFQLFICSSFATSIYVSGVIPVDSTWNVDTVIVTGDITINNNVTLTINPGTTVEFQGHYYIDVDGTLLAEGTSSDKIKFTVSDTSGFSAGTYTGWQGIKFYNTNSSNDTSKFKYCIFEYGNATDNGYGENYTTDYGGALTIYNYSRVEISYCDFINNKAEFNGGAIYMRNNNNDKPLENCSFINNSATNPNYNTYGGSIYAVSSNLYLKNCLFDNSTVLPYGYGGHLYIDSYGYSQKFENCKLQNSSARAGGGIYLAYCGKTDFINCLITDNSAVNYQGGGICINSSYDTITFINSTIADNTSYQEGGGIYNASRVKLINTIIANNTGAIGGSSYEGYTDICNNSYMVSQGYNFIGNIEKATITIHSSDLIGKDDKSLDPFFAANYELSDTSLCINMGGPDTSGLNLPLTDADGNPRIYDGTIDRIDIGALEYQGEPSNRQPLILDVFDIRTDISATKTCKIKFLDTDVGDNHTININTSVAEVTVQNLSGDTSGSTYDLVPYAGWSGHATIYLEVTDNSGAANNTDVDSFDLYVTDDKGGHIVYDETWSADTIRINDDIYIHEGATITILPGVRVEAQDHYEIISEGTIIAEGTSADTIFFTVLSGNEGSGWEGIEISNATEPQPSVFKFCRFEYSKKDYSNSHGGALLVNSDGKVLVENCVFTQNIAYYGGAIALNSYAQAIIKNSAFFNNIGYSYGGAVYTQNNVIASLSGNILYKNTSDYGGAIYFNNYNELLLANNTITNNSAQYAGGGIYINYVYYGEGSIINNIIWGNFAPISPQVHNYGYATYNKCDIEGGKEEIEGEFIQSSNYIDNIDIDPKFIDINLDNYHLSDSSILIDFGLGDTTGLSLLPLDIDQNARVVRTIDIGAYEYQGSPINRLPILVKNGNKTIAKDDEDTYIVEFEDTDIGDSYTITVTSDNSHVTILDLSGNTSGSSYRVVPDAEWEGTANITVTVIDQSGEVSSYNTETYTVYVGDIHTLCGTINTDLEIDTDIDILQINCNVTIANGVTLTIPHGLLVKFAGNYQITVYGTMLVAGSDDNPVVFTTNNPENEWGGIYLNSADDTCYFEYCNFEFSRRSDGGAIYINNSDINLNYCNFSDNTATSNGGALRATNSNSSVAIANSVFENNKCRNGGGAININSNIDLNIDNCIFTGNKAGYSYYGGAIYVNQNCPVQIQNSTFNNNKSTSGGAIYISSYFGNTILDGNTLDSNLAYANGGAVYLGSYGDTCLIINNNIRNNNTLTGWAGAVYIDQYNVVNFNKNEVYNNQAQNSGGIRMNNYTTFNSSNNVYSYNTSTNSNGGAIYTSYYDTISFVNDIFDNNQSVTSNGGAIYANPYNIVSIESCDFKNNRSASSGGALYINNYSYTNIGNSSFNKNNAGYGGALRINNAYEAEVFNSNFSDNIANNYGGGLYIVSSNNIKLTDNIINNNQALNYSGGGINLYNNTNNSLTGNLIKNNAAQENGGGIYLYSLGQADVINNEISNNTARLYGGAGIYSNTITTLHLYNNTIVNNITAYSGAGILFTGSYSSNSIKNCIIWGNTGLNKSQVFQNGAINPEITHCNIEGGISSITGGYTGIYTNNIDVDPLFIDEPEQNYQVSPYSHVVDAGDPDTTGMHLGNTDLLKNSRIFNDTVDMGCYEVQVVGNKVPVIVPVSDQITETNTPLWMSVEYSDPDSNEVHTISITSDNPNVTIDSISGDTTNSKYRLVPATDWKGSANITVTVLDNSGVITSLNTNTYSLHVGKILNLCGGISTDSTITQEIVLLNCNVTVNSGATLTLLPGTFVQSQADYTINISNGALKAEGTEAEPIIFTANDKNTGWYGLSFLNCTDTSFLKYCTIEYSKLKSQGGAIYAQNSDNIIIDHSIIQNNTTSSAGGGIFLTNSNITIMNTIIRNNETANDGGGLYGNGCTMINCLVTGNYAPYGGGMQITDSSVLVNNTICNNTAGYGGGIYLSTNHKSLIQNSIIYDNTCSFGQVYNNSADPAIYYTSIEGGFGGIIGSDVTDTIGLIDGDPLFTGVSGDYSLGDGNSLCINAGDTAGVPVLEYDIANNKRILFNVIDLGAYEYQNHAPTAISVIPSEIQEGEPVGTQVGILNTSDPDNPANDQHTYVFVSGGTDNSSFNISGDQLLSSSVFDRETKDSYSIRVQSTDIEGETVTENITISIGDANDNPPSANDAEVSIYENIANDSVFYVIDITDADITNNFKLSIIQGNDNNAFNVSNSGELSVRNNNYLDYETQPVCSLQVNIDDGEHDIQIWIIVHLIDVVKVDESIAASDYILDVLPNPNNGIFILKVGKFNSDRVTIDIISIDGKIIWNKELNMARSGHELNMDLHNLPEGIYNIKITDQDNTYNKQIIIR